MTGTQPISSLVPARTAIIAVDFQYDIVSADGAFAAMFHAEVERVGVIPAAVRLLEAARAAGAKIVYSRATFSPGYPEMVANIPILADTAAYGCLVDGTPGAEVMDVVEPHDGDLTVAHHRISSFHGTVLDAVLRGAGVDTIVLAGVATNLAVESTARAGADLGYRTVVVADACSTTTRAAHEASLDSLSMLAQIVSVDQLCAALASSVSTAACQLIEPEARGGSHARRHDGHGTPSDHEG
jgi:nicotinamidase-related amidase